MAKGKKKSSTSEAGQRAFDERTRLIEDYIAKLRARIAAEKAAGN